MKKILFVLCALMLLCSCGERVSYREISEAEQMLAQYNGYVVKAKSTFKVDGKYECILWVTNDSAANISVGPVPKSIYDQYGLDDTIKIVLNNEIIDEEQVIETNQNEELIVEQKEEPIKQEIVTESNQKQDKAEIININGVDILIIEKDGKKEAIKLN